MCLASRAHTRMAVPELKPNEFIPHPKEFANGVWKITVDNPILILHDTRPMTSIVVDVSRGRRATSQRATPFLSGVGLLWSFRSLDSSAAVLKQLLVLQLTQLRTSRTRAACSCRHRISRYQIKKPKTANFIGIKYNSQSIFASLSHSNLENTTCVSRRQDLFQGEGKKNLAENSQS